MPEMSYSFVLLSLINDVLEETKYNVVITNIIINAMNLILIYILTKDYVYNVKYKNVYRYQYVNKIDK